MSFVITRKPSAGRIQSPRPHSERMLDKQTRQIYPPIWLIAENPAKGYETSHNIFTKTFGGNGVRSSRSKNASLSTLVVMSFGSPAKRISTPFLPTVIG